VTLQRIIHPCISLLLISHISKFTPFIVKYVILLATNWNYTDGGINSFNFDFALALGKKTINTSYKVVCLSYRSVLHDLVTIAAQNNVIIASLDLATDVDLGIEHMPQIVDVISKFDDAKFFYFIGHDALTGPLATTLNSDNRFPSNSVVIHHMDYESYYAIKGDNTPDEMDEKFFSQTKILNRADFVIAIGPKLRTSALSKVKNAQKVSMLIPGVQNISPNDFIEKISAITFGRYDIRNDRLKQMALAARAFAEFVAELAGAERKDATLKVIGITEIQQQQEFIKMATEGIEPYINIITLPYSADRGDLFRHLVDSNVCLMLSVHEGFGLVGWEAIAAGVPLVISDNTGLFEFLQKEIGDRPLSDFGVISCSVQGSMDGMVNEADKAKLKAAYNQVSKYGAFYKKGILELRSMLLAKYSWHNCASAFLSLLLEIEDKSGRKSNSVEEVLSERRQVIIKLNTEEKFQPILQLVVRSTASPLTYLSRSVVFSGREMEFGNLLDFCGSNSRMMWWTIIGEGGSGKSRLALELLLDLVISKGWYGGFLGTKTFEEFNWDNWTPAFDTILIVDYAARFQAKIQDFLDRLYRASEFSSKKVRVLLLERNEAGDWWKTLNYLQQQGKILAPWAKYPMNLTSLDDVSMIRLIGSFQHFDKLGKTKAEVLALLKKSPKYNIPLYAILLLANLHQSKNGQSENENVFENFLQREEIEVWLKVMPDEVVQKKHKNLVAFLTIVGGLPSKDFAEYTKHELFPVKKNPELLRALNLLNQEQDYVHSVEPDLLGEHFVFRNFLSGGDFTQVETDLIPILNIAWDIAPQKVLGFFQRIIYDFPNFSFSSILPFPTKIEHVGFWCSLQSDLMTVSVRKLGVSNPELFSLYITLVEVIAKHEELLPYNVMALVKIIETAVLSNDFKNAGYYKEEFKNIISKFITHPELVLSTSYFCFRLIKYLTDDIDLDQAEEFLEILRTLRDLYNSSVSASLIDKIEIEVEWAKERKENVDFAEQFDFSHKIEINTDNISKYYDEARALIVKIQVLQHGGSFAEAFNLFSRLIEITRNSTPEHLIAFLRYQQFSAQGLITTTLLAGQLNEELIFEHNKLAISQYPEELAHECLVFWNSHFHRFLRAYPNVENVLTQLLPIIEVDELPENTWNFYWDCVLTAMQFHLENNEEDKALKSFQTIQGMFDIPIPKQDPATASAAAIYLSLYFQEDSGDVNNRKYYNFAKEYAEIAGTNFKMIYSMLSGFNK